MPPLPTPEMTIPELSDFLDEVFPQVRGEFTLLDLTDTTLSVRLNVQEHHLRPGGTVSGPSIFSLADVGAYLMMLARIGREALTVTTNCTIDFMRKPEAGRDLICEIRLLKLGRALGVLDGLIYSEGRDQPVARASLTYSIPPGKDMT